MYMFVVGRVIEVCVMLLAFRDYDSCTGPLTTRPINALSGDDGICDSVSAERGTQGETGRGG